MQLLNSVVEYILKSVHPPNLLRLFYLKRNVQFDLKSPVDRLYLVTITVSVQQATSSNSYKQRRPAQWLQFGLPQACSVACLRHAVAAVWLALGMQWLPCGLPQACSDCSVACLKQTVAVVRPALGMQWLHCGLFQPAIRAKHCFSYYSTVYYYYCLLLLASLFFCYYY